MSTGIGGLARRGGLALGVAALALATTSLSSRAQAAGVVVLYTADGLEDFYKSVLPAFERQNGVRVETVTAGSGEVVNRATIEKDSPKADVIVTLPPFVQKAANTDILTPYTSPADAHIPVAARAADGRYRTFVDNYFSFAINPDTVKTPPQSLDDLLKPEFAGKIAYSNPATAGDGMAVVLLSTSLLGEDQGFAYLKKLEPSVKFHTKGTGYLDVLLSRQEISAANGDLQMDLADAAGGGLSLQPIFLAAHDGGKPTTFALPYAIGLVTHAPHDAAGRKLIDYLLSVPVQEKVADVYGLPARDDVKLSGPNAATVEKATAGVILIPVDWVKVAANQAAWTQRWKSEVIGGADKPLTVVKPAT
jgi:2-aminoethylphosphonate transport system substrate-binding protein